jgi:hypothetical protein
MQQERSAGKRHCDSCRQLSRNDPDDLFVQQFLRRRGRHRRFVEFRWSLNGSARLI